MGCKLVHTNLHDSIKGCVSTPITITCSTHASSQSKIYIYFFFDYDKCIPSALFCVQYCSLIGCRFPHSSDTCFRCGKRGHWAESCYKFDRQQTAFPNFFTDKSPYPGDSAGQGTRGGNPGK